MCLDIKSIIFNVRLTIKINYERTLKHIEFYERFSRNFKLMKEYHINLKRVMHKRTLHKKGSFAR
ncbi:hypothetical protein GFV16_12475 [Bacillus megaterium]|nr:hypothetical protein [Priestia megaterium]